MFTTLVSIFVIASMVLGGGGVTVFASQDSLPGQALYGVKTLGEDVLLGLASRTQAQLALELEYANRRVEEMGTLAGRGEPLPEALEVRYQKQMEAAFRLCAGLDDAALLPALDQVRQRLQEHERLLQGLRAQGDPQAQAALDRVRERVRLQLQLAEDGLGDPQGFRRQVQAGGPFGSNRNSGEKPGGGTGECEDCPRASGTPGPGNGSGPGPQASGTPASGDGYRPGPRPVPSQEPGEGVGNNTGGAGSGFGPGPQPSASPDPGSGYGPGPGPDASETPGEHPQDGSGQQYGPGPRDGAGPGPNATQEPGGNGPGGAGSGDGTCDGCGDGPHEGEGNGSGHEGGGKP